MLFKFNQNDNQKYYLNRFIYKVLRIRFKETIKDILQVNQLPEILIMATGNQQGYIIVKNKT